MQLPASWDGGRRLGLRLSARSTPAEQVVTRGGLGREELADVPLVARRRRRRARRGGAGRARRGEGAAGAAARQVGQRRPARLRAGPGVPAPRADRRRRPPPPSCSRCAPLPSDAPADDAAAPGHRHRADGWIGDVLAGRADQHVTPVELPASFLATLRPYQQRGRRLAGVPLVARAGRVPGRRHGPGQDRPDAGARGRRAGRRRARARRCCCARCRWSAPGSGRRRSFAPEPAGPRPPRQRPAARRRAASGELARADLVVTTYATAARDAEELAGVRLAPARARRGAGDQERRTPRPRRRCAASTPGTGSPSPAPRWRTGSSELWSVMDVLNPGLLGTTERFRQRFAIPVERHGDTEAAGLLRRITQPYLLRRLKTDPDDRRRPAREDRDHAALPAHPRAGLALPHDRRRHDGEDRGLPGHAAPRQRARGDDQAQAGLQPPGPPAARRLARSAGAAARSSGWRSSSPRSSTRATGCCASPSSPSSATCWCRTCPRGFDTDIAFLHGGLSKARRDAMVERFQAGDGPAGPAAVAEGGRHRADPHRSQPRRAPGPLVEPRGGEPGHRPRVPHRAEAQRPGPQVRVPRHRRGADRRADHQEEGAGRDGRRRRRGLAHGAVHRHPARGLRAGRRGGRGRWTRMPDQDGRPWWMDAREEGVSARARKVEGGIQINATRGPVARTWWSQRFLQVLEALGVGGRLARGRTYARQGQIVAFEIGAGSARAQVQGTATQAVRRADRAARVRQGGVGADHPGAGRRRLLHRGAARRRDAARRGGRVRRPPDRRCSRPRRGI